MAAIKVTIIIPVYNSHRAFGRQLRHWKRLNLSEAVEWIIMDDGSEPPLRGSAGVRNLLVVQTNDRRPWTEGLAFNRAAEMARGEYLYKTDIDHIVSRESVEAVLAFTGDKMIFPRYFAVLDHAGRVTQDERVLRSWKLRERYFRRGLNGGTHGNTWAMRKSLFFELGAFRVRRPGRYSGSLDSNFNHKYALATIAGKVQPQVGGPRIWTFPIGRFTTDNNNNPHGFFHDLSRVKS